MPKQLLTNSFVQDARCPADKPSIDHFDTKITGLLLKVLRSGRKSYYLRYKNLRGKKTEVKLADASILPAADARELARKHLAQLAMGEDPFAAKSELKLVPTFAEFINDRYMPYIKGYKKSWEADDSYLRNHLLPAFGKKHLDEITKHDVIQFHHGMHTKGYAQDTCNRHGMHTKVYAQGTCNRCLILLRFAFNLAVRWEIPGITTNPTKDVPLFEDLAGKKERFLTEIEAQRLYESVCQSDNTMLQYIIPMLILTGARKREVLDSKWEDFDLDRKQWRIPTTKTGRPRHVPLSDGVLQLLATIPRHDNCPWVFANPKSHKPFVSIFISWNTARKNAKLADVRLHDLRHSFASFLVNAGRSLYEVQKILGHTQIKTTQRYAHLSQDTLLDAANIVSNSVSLTRVLPNNVTAVAVVQAC